ncbi:MAG: pyridoxal phosphate-dependent aminotransferase [Bacteroides sp.]|nr:pyridoxal phosphate-dependent aminotransferase [Ruminococcus flavefaciens]MCM1555554.1 pyridoxal phosphate-dependent aminotransferase [Bacteroides sp.]
MKQTVIPKETVDGVISQNGLKSVGQASIREVKKLINDVEKASGTHFIRMEMGIPGLPAAKIGVEAEIAALNKGIASLYPEVGGLPELKTEISRFAKNFLNIEVNPAGCIPTVGSMQGSFAAFLTVSRAQKGKNTTLFTDPGFAVHKQQHRVLGIPFESFDVYNFRGDKLREKLESYLSKGNISSIFYSNPNNPSWICFTDDELRTIADLAKKYNVIVMEDLAYFGMDFRHDISTPGVPPFQPTVARYTDRYILFVSSSKAFSYAGQRIGMMMISDALYQTDFPDFKQYYNSTQFGHTMIFGTVYCLSSGTAHSPQYALHAILKATNEGKYNFVHETRIYGEKAHKMKQMFLKNGFYLAYDKDVDKDLSDGFYFTVGYPGMNSEELLHNLLYFGISAISLGITGSEREGIRACVSLVPMEDLPELEKRLEQFKAYFGE